MTIGVNRPVVVLTLPLRLSLPFFSEALLLPNNRLKNPLFDFLTNLGFGAPKSAGPVLRRKSARESVVGDRTDTGSRAVDEA